MTSIARLSTLLLLIGPLAGFAVEPSPQDIAGRTHPPLYSTDQPLGDLGEWYALDIIATTSAAGATLTKQEDGSILATGHDPDADTYTLTARTTLRGITALRLDALADDSLPGRGPGRASNGNLTINELILTANGRPVEFTRAEADYSQRGYDAPLAIDGDRATGWSIGTGGEDHRLILHPASPIGDSDTTELTFTIHQDHPARKGYTLGRFRLIASTNADITPSDEPNFQPLLVHVGFATAPIDTFASAAGATSTPHPGSDGSLQVSGSASPNDTYTLTLHTDLDRITGIRVESLPGQRPNFALTELSVQAAPASDPANVKFVKLHSPSATHSQRGLPVERAIDGNEKTFWGVTDREGETCAAAFAFETPVGHEGGSLLTVTLKQKVAIDRLRLSLTTARESRFIVARPPTPPAAAKKDIAPAAPQHIERYYNVAGYLYADPQGHQWLPARRWRQGFDGYEGGSSTSSDLPLNPLLKQSLSGIDAFRFTLPNGRYRLALLFVEPREGTLAGYRKFDVHVEEVKVLNDLDLIRAARGVGQPFLHVLPDVPVKDGRLDVEFYGEKPLLSAIAIIEAEPKP